MIEVIRMPVEDDIEDDIEMELYMESDSIYTIKITLNGKDTELKYYPDLHSAVKAFNEIAKSRFI